MSAIFQKYGPFLFLLLITGATEAICQGTVFTIFKNDLILAEEYYKNKNYLKALDLYQNIEGKSNVSPKITLKIARSQYHLKKYEQSVTSYEKLLKTGQDLDLTDIYLYAEAQSSLGNYSKAIEFYKLYLNHEPDNELIFKKIWRLDNRKYLYEDSIYYEVNYLPINTEYGEMCAVPYKSGIVFISNRKQISLIEQMDGSLNAPFYQMYLSKTSNQPLYFNDMNFYEEPMIFDKDLRFRYHTGPVAFYDSARKMVLVTAEDDEKDNSSKTLKLYFAEENNSNWKITGAFPFNSNNHSISEPTISEDGKILYFSSDMKGGFGGKDIYKSEYLNGEWTKPVNLGEHINTIYDEVFPYLHENFLYFSSTGHPGLGGLDIFKVKINASGYGEIENVGYPLNTNFDDFGIVIDSLETKGFLTSNRREGGYNDDIYIFEMDIQPYPLEISGVIKYIEHNWSDSSEIKVLPNVKLVLIDNQRNVVVAESTSDNTGNFVINVPYYSEYKMKVLGDNIGEGIVSFVVPKHRREKDKYEIVVVKDDFKSY